MKVLVVSQYFWPESFRINEVVESLVSRGHDVDVLTAKPNYPDGVIHDGYSLWRCERGGWKGATIHRVPIIPRGKKNALRLSINYLSFVISAATFGVWMLWRTKPDVIFVYAPSPLIQALPAIFIGCLKRCKVVLNVQDLWPESLEATGYISNKFIIGMVSKTVQFIYRNVDLILVSSRLFRESIVNFSPTAEIIYHPNSVDTTFCNPVSDHSLEIPALSEGFCVVFAGNVGAAQAVHVIVAAAEILRDQCPNVRLVVIGSGSELEWMRHQKVSKQLENLFLTGRYPVESMPYILSRASVLLVTLANHPIFSATIPNKIQAYLAVGKPVIACMNGEGGRIIEDAGAGIAVPAEDAIALAAAVVKMKSKSQYELDKMGASGKAYYREVFDHEALVTELVNHLESAARRTK